jgi:hypothetical protein
MLFITNHFVNSQAKSEFERTLCLNRRRHTHLSWLLLNFFLVACSQPQLNSERIEQHFGSYGVEVLDSSMSHRVTNLYSLDEGHKVCRTLALVLFDEAMNPAIKAEHSEITAGGSIGAVFKKNGWTIIKVNLELGTVNATGEASLIEKSMSISLPAQLALHVYRFKLRKAEVTIEYATIVEIHHPDYLSPQDLQNLYGAFPSESFPAPAMAAIEAQVQSLLRE